MTDHQAIRRRASRLVDHVRRTLADDKPVDSGDAIDMLVDLTTVLTEIEADEFDHGCLPWDMG